MTVSLRDDLNSIFQFKELKNTSIIHYSLFVIHFSIPLQAGTKGGR